jgi:hypothetical protein
VVGVVVDGIHSSEPMERHGGGVLDEWVVARYASLVDRDYLEIDGIHAGDPMERTGGVLDDTHHSGVEAYVATDVVVCVYVYVYTRCW